MKSVNLIFPHQLFLKSPLLQNENEIYLIEEQLFFRQYSFHKQKIAFHRATMKAYEEYLRGMGKEVCYVDSQCELSDVRHFSEEIKEKKIAALHVVDPVDDWLEQRIQGLADTCKLEMYDSPQFVLSRSELLPFFRSDKKSFFQTTFYKQQRKSMGILLDKEQNPTGGKWTYDSDNRKKYPAKKTPPPVQYPDRSDRWDEAVDYTQSRFSDNPGSVSKQPLYPVTHKEAEDWLQQFLTTRFHDFGIYEDAIVKDASVLNHSVLSPLINVGLVLPDQVVDRCLDYAEKNNIPINSTEGFVRQIIGWREFVRGMYVCKGRFSRTRNFWGFKRKIPSCFYDGTTGVQPIDHTIKKVLETGYCHHIERLMVLGNFMLLCEFDPDEVYRWFMELFIDAYDWVMVPNVYGMSLFADGGTFATKPYIGGANYIKKMSDYPRGDWEQVWDGLFWRFVKNHASFFKGNPRTSMLAHTYARMDSHKQKTLLDTAERFIQEKLHGNG